jgi:hypothetical protein
MFVSTSILTPNPQQPRRQPRRANSPRQDLLRTIGTRSVLRQYRNQNHWLVQEDTRITGVGTALHLPEHGRGRGWLL